ncbi:PilZ domain-containing protein [Sphingomonas sp. 1P06PA]|uniref:PilZ domain-containing protein n=1 Tax=Sphingomonas sp. 1P06PA TaxID=554121 RepID=UPI0039A5EFC5
MTLAARMFPDVDADRRGKERRRIDAVSTARAQAAGPCDVVVNDLSCDGFAMVCPPGTEIEGDFTIGLPGAGRFRASVVRRDGARYGCRFAQPLSPQAMATAFASDPVVTLGIPRPAGVAGTAEPHVEKWHPAMRLAFLIGLTTTVWTSILHLI